MTGMVMDLTTVDMDMEMAGEVTEAMEDMATVVDMEDTGLLTDTQDTHTMDMVAMVVTVATDMGATDMEVMVAGDTVDMDHIIIITVAMAGDTIVVLSDTIVDFLLDTEVLLKSSGDP